MKPKNWLLCFFMWFCCLLGTEVLAAPVSNTAFEAYKELMQIKLDSIKDAQKSDAEHLGKRVDDEMTRTGQAVDRFGVIVAWAGLLITVLLAGLGLVSYIAVKKRVKEEAEEAAKSWFAQYEQNLKRRIEQLEQATTKVEEKSQQAHADIDASVKVIAEYTETVISRKGVAGEGQTGISGSDAEVLQESNNRLKQKPEAEYTAEDWYARGHAAYAKKEYFQAIYFWGQSAQVVGAEKTEIANSLFNKGIAQREFGLLVDAINTFDEIILRFRDATEASLKEWVAGSLLSKGDIQRGLGQHEEAINAYNQVVDQFNTDVNVSLQERVAVALLKKGVAQQKNKQNSESIKTYNEIINRFSTTTEPALQKPVALALLNKGISQEQLGLNAEAIQTYDEIIRCFVDATEPDLQKTVEIARTHKQKLTP